MVTENLWGKLPEIELTWAPFNILLGQAASLKEMTKDLLIAEVERNAEPDRVRGKESRFFVLELRIVAPSLNHYTYSVLTVRHGITMIPLKIDSSDGKNWECGNEDEFVDTLKQILSSSEVKKVIAGLLTQIQADHMLSKPTHYVNSTSAL
jgi:hypothetical protein